MNLLICSGCLMRVKSREIPGQYGTSSHITKQHKRAQDAIPSEFYKYGTSSPETVCVINSVCVCVCVCGERGGCEFAFASKFVNGFYGNN